MPSLYLAAARCIAVADPDEKIALTQAVAQAWAAQDLDLADPQPPAPITAPGRPARPRLVPPGQVPWRGYKTPTQRAALVHALAHIELNAMDLAWDAVYRFRGLPEAYSGDWIGVAVDEARHFALLRERLRAYGFDYGDFDAHDGLWEMATKTADSLVARMALVPRVLEARSLDVTPGIQERLRSVGDPETAAAIAIIEHDELAHVQAGSRWFRYACQAQGLDPDATFLALVDRYMKGRVKGPFRHAVRMQAGFTERELAGLEGLEAAAR